jgi:hypothetical protein
MKSVRIEAGLRKEIRKRPVVQRRAIGRRIAEIQEAIGQPHLHKGIASENFGMNILRPE